MDGSKYDARVITLYGVILQAMEEGEDFPEIRAKAQDWFCRQGGFYLRTDVELKDGNFYIVVHYHTSFDMMLAGMQSLTNDVAVPLSYIAKAQERYYDQ